MNNLLKRIIILSLSLLFTQLCAYAQHIRVDIPSPPNKHMYGDDDVSYEKTVYEVEDMPQDEIRAYNSMLNEGVSPDESLLRINAGRAQRNLTKAPATLFEYHFNGIDSIGAADIKIVLINSLPKTIKEITFTFEFEGTSGPVYDIKTGDQYLILKFNNLTGRPDSINYSDIANGHFKCLHYLSAKDASYKKLFFNKKAKHAMLNSVLITYDDGTTSTKITEFRKTLTNSDHIKGSYTDRNIYNYGPLSPVTQLINAHNQNANTLQCDINGKPGTEGLVGYTLERWGRPHSKWAGSVKLKVVVSERGHIIEATVVGGSGEAYQHKEVRDYCVRETLKSAFSVPKNKTTVEVGYVTWKFI